MQNTEFTPFLQIDNSSSLSYLGPRSSQYLNLPYLWKTFYKQSNKALVIFVHTIMHELCWKTSKKLKSNILSKRMNQIKFIDKNWKLKHVVTRIINTNTKQKVN